MIEDVSFYNSARHERKGIALFVIIAMVFIIFLLFSFFSLSSGQLHFSSHNNLETELATQSGRAFADVFWIFARDVFQNRRGCEKIYPGAGLPSPLYPFVKSELEKIEIGLTDFEKSDLIQKAFKEIEAEIPGLTQTRAKMHFKVRKFSDSFAHGDLCLNVSFRLKKESYSFDYFREFKLIRCLAPVVSKFSLFLRSNPGENSFNRISKGFQDEIGNERAFVVFNHDQTFVSGDVDVWKKSGWIYMGGGPVTLNLDGTHPCRKESDSFIFWPGLYSDNLSQALPYSCSSFLGSSRLRVRFAPSGAMKDWKDSAVLKAVLGGAVLPQIEKSSVLRLFGNRDRMTPTKVFGRVNTNYVLYSTLILDQNNDSIADSIISAQGIEQRAIYPLPRLTDAQLFQPPIFPRFLSSKGHDLFLDSEGLNGVPQKIEDVFSSFDSGDRSYVGYMTKLARDFSPSAGMNAYNSLYDQILESSSGTGSKNFPAARIFSPREYPDEAGNVSIPLDFSRPEFQFRGDLNRFSPGDFFDDLNIYGRTYANESELFKESEIRNENGQLLINDPMVTKVSGQLHLSLPIQANAPAIIVCEGDLKVFEVARSTNSSKLTLVSLRGDIILSGRRYDGVSLVAPAGEVKWDSPVEIKGSICANTISPGTFGLGGSLTWDSGMDITSIEAAAKSVAILVGPNITMVRKAN